VHVLGFPIGVLSDQLFGPERSYPVARRGSIAWIRPALDKVNTEFLIDAFIFPGNSGGPVFKPCRTTVGQGQVETDCLIGMVKSYMPYTDSALSRQTGQSHFRRKLRAGCCCSSRVNPESNRRVFEDPMSDYFANFCTRQFLISTT